MAYRSSPTNMSCCFHDLRADVGHPNGDPYGRWMSDCPNEAAIASTRMGNVHADGLKAQLGKPLEPALLHVTKVDRVVDMLVSVHVAQRTGSATSFTTSRRALMLTICLE